MELFIIVGLPFHLLGKQSVIGVESQSLLPELERLLRIAVHIVYVTGMMKHVGLTVISLHSQSAVNYLLGLGKILFLE